MRVLFASRSKGKAQPQSRELASSSPRTVPFEKRTWTDVDTVKYSLSDYVVSKKLIHRLRQGTYPEKITERFNSGESETIFRNFLVLSSLVWRKVEEKHGKRRRKQEKIPVLQWFVRSNLVPPSSSRPVRTQSRWSYFTGQYHYSGRFLPVQISSRMCNQLTFINSGLIPGGQILSNRQTVFFLLCGSYGQGTQGSWHDRLGSTATCTVHA